MVKLYLLTNRETGIRYGGVTGLDTADLRFVGHTKKSLNPKTKLHAAIAQYGPDAFEVVELHTYPSWDAAYAAENALVDALDLIANGYNMIPGGRANPMHSPEVRAKASKSHTGKKQSEETKAKRAASLRGRKRPPEVCARISATMKGREFTPEWRAKMSLSAIARRVRESALREVSL